ncbi:flagellar basal body rod protein FlgB [Candidatus Latescibacterota bacterium]
MLEKILFDNKTNIMLEKMLGKAALSQKVIAANVANVSTPGYRRLGVTFGDQLKNAMKPGMSKLKRTHPKHLPSSNRLKKVKPEVVIVDDGYFNGINNVNIEREMVDLAKNQLDFNTAAKLMNLKFTQLRSAIRGRR